MAKSDPSIASRLKAWRHALGLTQAQFAQRIGAHIGQVQKYEIGLNVPGGEVLAAIARTGVNMNWLLTGDGEMLPLAMQVSEKPGKYEVPDTTLARRIEAIAKLIEGIEDEGRRAALLDELFARAQEAQRLDELERAVRTLTARRV